MRTLLPTLVTALLLAACSGGPPRGQPEPTAAAGIDPQLAGSEWILSTLDGQSPLAGSRITLQFEGPTAGGNAGCNSYGAEIRAAAGGVFDAGEAARTAMACLEPEGVMEQEEAYLAALASITAYRLQPDSLSLLDQAGDARLVFSRKEETTSDPAALVGSAWTLAAVDGQPPTARRAITLSFGPDAYWGRSDCRSYVGSYQAGADDIAFPTTAMLGEPCAGEQLLLPESGDYQLAGQQLVLTGARGNTLIYEALPPGGPAAEALTGVEWRLLAFIGPGELPAAVQEPLPGSAITASFEADGRLSGSAGCNRYMAAYESTAEALQIAEAGLTRMFCTEPEGVMDQEAQFSAWLAEVLGQQSGGGLLWLDAGDDRALLFEQITPQ